MDAIYARQSVDRADSISIESQVDFCRYETRGEAYRTYIDRGYSGKNTERPGFQAMMSDIESGRIRKVIVYKLDRISRSILDFSAMMERFEKYRVEFVSTTEKFDTSSPVGRAMLNICIVFAQLERETIQKRVSDAYFSRSQKGFYMGGRIPYGYRLVPTTIGGVKTSMYEIVPEEAAVIRLMFELYSEPECSYGDLVRYFEARGITKHGKPWERTRMADTLRNSIYVRADLSVYQFYQEQGAIVVNAPSDFIGTNGCYYYRGKDSSGRKQMNFEGNYLILAPHEGIVPSDIWLKCRRKCLRNRQVKINPKAKNTWLAGKIKCGRCGYALVDKRYGSSPARYLLCSNRMNNRACPGPGHLDTGDMEALIYREMRKKLALFPSLRRQKQGPAINPERTALKIELTKIEQEISALLERLAGADEVMYRYISRRVGELDARKNEIAAKISEHTRQRERDGQEIDNHLTMWEELSFDDKRRTADQLIKAIYATEDAIQIEWRI